MRFVTLGDVTRPIRGVIFQASDVEPRHRTGLIACLTTSAVQKRIDWASARYIPEESVTSAAQVISPGDLLVSTANSASLVGKTALVTTIPERATFGAFVTVLRPTQEIEPAYLALWTQTRRFLRDARALGSHTTSISNIRVADLLRIRLPLPDPAEQRRIAISLVDRLASADEARDRAAVRNTASSDLRVRLIMALLPLAPGGQWPWVPLDTVADFLDGMRRPVSSAERASRLVGVAVADQVPYYGANGQTGWIDDYLFDEPLVLLAEDGGAFGSSRIPISYRVNGRAWVNNHAHVLRPRQGVDVDYLGFALSIRPDIGALVSGSTRAKLNRSVAGAIKVPLPPHDVQTGIVADLKARLSKLDAIDSRLGTINAAIESMPGALLRRAFGDAAA